MSETKNNLLVLFVPISILWKVKITLARKIILIGLFSLVLVTMAATIVRGGDVVIAAFGSKGELSTVFYYFWLYVEVAMGEWQPPLKCSSRWLA